MQKTIGKLPDALVACVGGGSNAVGMFYPFSEDLSVKLLGVEAGGDGKTPWICFHGHTADMPSRSKHHST